MPAGIRRLWEGDAVPDAKTLQLGPVGQVVVRNIRELSAGVTLRVLSDRLGKLGRPILPSVLHRLMQGGRRVDADDLVALALALQVTPNALLLPRDTRPEAEVTLAPQVRERAWAAWGWADGRYPLPATAVAGEDRFARESEFARNARPAFGGGARTEVLAEVYELADRIEAYLAAADPVAQGAQRDRVVRSYRKMALVLEELLEDDDAAAQLRGAARTLPAPAVDYAEPPQRTEENS